MNQYETMFLMDPNFASEFDNARKEIERILGRANAKIVFLEKWDERKLAYEIKGRKRGCYVLCYFQSDAETVAGIERDARLSDNILRILIKRADGITEDRMRSFLPHARAGTDDRESGDDASDSRPRRRETVGVGAGDKSAEPKPKRAAASVTVDDAEEDKD